VSYEREYRRSGRGQITLPASMRRRLGIKAGGVLVVEDRKGNSSFVRRRCGVGHLYGRRDRPMEREAGLLQVSALDLEEGWIVSVDPAFL